MRAPTTAVVLLAILVPPFNAAAQEMVPAREALRQAGHEMPTPAEREEEMRRDARTQRLWSAALIGAGGAAGAAVGLSKNKWPIDEGWVGAAIAGVSLGFGIFGLLDPMDWGEVDAAIGGVASNRPRGAGSGLASGASLSLSW